MAADALTAYLRVHCQALVEGSEQLRSSAASVHATRVAVRRLRSTLRTFRTLFEPGSTSALDAQLRWYAQVLGADREFEVMADRFAAALSQLPGDVLDSAAVRRIDVAMAHGRTNAQRELAAVLRGSRYRRLRAAVERFTQDPPLRRAPTPSRLGRRARRMGERAERRVRASTAEPINDANLHRARKSAKRARYAAELLRGVEHDADNGKEMARHWAADARYFERLQELLGEHQDAAVAAEQLRAMASDALTSGDSGGFMLGVLYAQQQYAKQASCLAASEWVRKAES